MIKLTLKNWWLNLTLCFRPSLRKWLKECEKHMNEIDLSSILYSILVYRQNVNSNNNYGVPCLNEMLGEVELKKALIPGIDRPLTATDIRKAQKEPSEQVKKMGEAINTYLAGILRQKDIKWFSFKN